MPSICICLANDPILSVFAFKPGERINIHVAFESELIPGRYRLQILDHKQNSRLNRYGKGLSDILVNNWPIPTSIRDDHLGIWQVKVNSIKNVRGTQKLVEEDGKLLAFSQIFFVEKSERVEFPLLGGDIIYQLPELVPIIEEEILREDEPIDAILMVQEEIAESSPPTAGLEKEIPITEVRGIGQTYASRLAKVNVMTVSDLWYHKDRIYLAEIMRISDKRLEKMLQDAELLLSEKAEEIGRLDIEPDEEIVPDDLRMVKGLTNNYIKHLANLGVRSKTELLDFSDIELLKKSLDISTNELGEILASIGRIIEPESVRKPELVKPLDQPVIVIKGIGKVTAEKLKSMGIITVENLLNSSFEMLSNITSEKTYQKWMRNASHYVGVPLNEDSEVQFVVESPSELLALPGIGLKTVEKLNVLNIFTLNDLISFEEPESLRKVLRMSESRFTAFIKKITGNS
ncbi:MAG: helix-hairpin-helix domain-containing protein [Candidatus Hodarchaeales archaeon]|jgi:predicted flap endonuclease-1-like 5' DNA nuclease